ncbi:MAG: mechanosensitive ion channel family protein [Methylococcaceae bacterium]|nr:mechanosensitive ion channel family protein [Methylococcaceae bacterium]
MKVLSFLFILLLSVTVFSAPTPSQKKIERFVDALKNINSQLSLVSSERDINTLLERKIDVLDKLLAQLKLEEVDQLPPANLGRNIDLLESRIKLNKERNNLIAAQRDQIKLAEHKVNLAIKKYLEYLIKVSKNYQSIESIVGRSQHLLDKSRKKSKKIVLPEVTSESSVFFELKSNYQRYKQTNESYQDILKYVISNPRKISSVHWFQEFSLLSAISYINHFDFIRPVNYKLAPFKVDVGGIVLSFIIYFLVYFCYPFIFKFTSWCVENYVIDEKAEQQEMIYHEIRKPIRALLIFFGLNLGTYAFFYKTDYRSSLEGFSFIVYSIILIWLIFKFIDSLVLVQIQKLSKANIQLRKELFNLGVQTSKGLVIMFFLALGLNHFGISLTAIMSTLGVGGLAFALAAKDTLSNLFGGMTILFDNVFKMGDWVKVGDVEGTVAEIGLRSTTVRTFDNALITIPNSLVSVSSVMNWNRRAVGRRIKMYISVTYESDMENLRKGVEDIRNMLKVHPDIANPEHKHAIKMMGFKKFMSKEDTQGIKSNQLVFVDRYNDFSIDILFYCFTRTVNWVEWLAVKEDVLYKIAEILKKNHLEFAYPTQVRIHREESARDVASSAFK